MKFRSKKSILPQIPEIDFIDFLDLIKIKCPNLIIISERNHSKMNLAVKAWYHAMDLLKLLAGTRGLRPLIAKNPHHLEPASPYNKSHRNFNIKVRPFKILFVTPLTRGLQSRFSLDSDTSSKSKNNLARLQLISRVFFCCLSML